MISLISKLSLLQTLREFFYKGNTERSANHKSNCIYSQHPLYKESNIIGTHIRFIQSTQDDTKY
jgi:hypothetical protein